MGKGDKKSRRGKIFAGSFGKSRPKKKGSNAENKENKAENKNNE